jgi:hypothetical protein
MATTPATNKWKRTDPVIPANIEGLRTILEVNERSKWGPPTSPVLTQVPDIRKVGSPRAGWQNPDKEATTQQIREAAEIKPKQKPTIPSKMKELFDNITDIINIDDKFSKLLTKSSVEQLQIIFREYIKHYLDEVTIQYTSRFTEEEIKAKLLEQLKHNNDIDAKFREINTRIVNLQQQTQQQSCSILNQRDWSQCIGICNTVLQQHITEELNSTAYKLRVLSHSFSNLKQKIQFKLQDTVSTLDNLTLDNFQMVLTSNTSTPPSPTSPKTRRVLPTPPQSPTEKKIIIGFGPNGTNKKSIVKELLQLLGISDVFMIDESIFRNKSICFKIIIFLIIKNNLAGIVNLKDIFNISTVKQELLRYLGNRYNIYISESLETCENMSCDDMIQQYTTGFKKIIGLYLWQHKTQEECEYQDKLKCKGTYRSGKEIEIQNGEEFDNSNYDLSEQYGLELLSNATIGLKIHVSGITNGIHLIEDHSSTPLNLTGKIISNPLFKQQLTSIGNFYYTQTPPQVKNCELDKARHHQRRCTTKSFADKYLKYKKKYLQLKQQYNM